MKKYDVYGIGNALVDKEFEVDDQFFIDAGIEKGFMTLIDDDKQQELINLLTRRYGLKKRAGGGSAANSMYAMSQFGSRVFFSCKVANDETGHFYVRELGNQNISTNLSAALEDGVTGRCLVMVTQDAERTMLTSLAISQLVSVNELDYDAIRDSKYAYTEGYLVTSPTARSAVLELKRYAKEHDVKFAMTFSDPAMVEYFKEGINEFIGEGVDLLFCNEKEALLWSGTNSLEDACKALEKKAAQFAVTRGARGALLFDGAQYLNVEPHTVRAVDTNGAGDMFSGAFLYGIAKGYDFNTAGKIASLASSLVVSQFGPRLSAEQHREILERLELSE
ncbi:MAG: adenosine kinase [Gammaproteobacteria bacterium]|nr:adenosine kinase [Gammaproteobacteria bacterium]MDP2348173.1 adenosine kinase [Gammaproteobacteria bacterium]